MDTPSSPDAPPARRRPTSFGEPMDLSSDAHRQLIGYLGLLLPVLLYVLAGSRPSAPMPAWVLLGSVSAYYYSGAVGVFVGILFGLALFLLTYRGYSNSVADRALGRFAAVCALCVALFPTGAPEGVPQLPWWSGITGWIHYGAAALLFGTFAAFSLWLFRRTDVPKGQPLPPEKRRRNVIFVVCGVVIVACILWAGSSLIWPRPIFWPESIALWAFAISWLTKGRARRSLASAARRMVSAMR